MTNTRLNELAEPFKPKPMPGRLNDTQRQLLKDATRSVREMRPALLGFNIMPWNERSLKGLVQRDLLEEQASGIFYVTNNGLKVARAIWLLTENYSEAKAIENFLKTALRTQTQSEDK